MENNITYSLTIKTEKIEIMLEQLKAINKHYEKLIEELRTLKVDLERETPDTPSIGSSGEINPTQSDK
jgi:hypothetical protein